MPKSAAFFSHDLPACAGLAPVPGIVSGVRAWLKRRIEISRIERELLAYTDRDLADLGLRRCDIPNIARRAVDGQNVRND